ncbi:hypothetical protein [Brasilonema octagenarum]|uniref:hypothetical protein n=1 Tax=Brasilonema octagenarum TaxID=417105 RepID=UPI00145DFD5F|nr:hypothetical protein [Brasilonema octagenarum]
MTLSIAIQVQIHLPKLIAEQSCTLAFSRILDSEEILIAYNTSTTERRSDFVIVDSTIQKNGGTMKFLYGKEGSVTVEKHPYPGNPCLFVHIDLEPMQFVILQQTR